MASELGVNTIQHTNGTDALTIDSSGRVNQPALPAWSAYNSSGGWSQTTPIVLDSTEVNRGTIYSTSTGVVTIPISGVYAIIAMVYTKNDSTEDVAIRIQKSTNSGSSWSNVTYGYSYPTNTALHVTVTQNILLDLDAGDQIRLTMTGSGEYWSGSQETRFSGHLIG